MPTILIKNGLIVNRGISVNADLYIKNERIERIDPRIDKSADKIIDATGLWVMPGIIDDQVHFREPGLTHKASIATESQAAVAGGVTSFMEMPNTKPPALTQKLLEMKYEIAAAQSAANYSFYMGASNENIEEVLKTDRNRVCGVKVFMGSSTGNMLVDDEKTLEGLFSQVDMLIATHCEDEETIRKNNFLKKSQYGIDVPVWEHPIIRNVEACLKSSSLAVSLAKKHGSKLHILHISTKDELDLFDNSLALKEKRITAEVCVHHLYFNSGDYESLGNMIKCNPAIKSADHQNALFAALLDDRLDVIATDHAPHTLEEKTRAYLKAPSGIPLVQHSMSIMLDFYHKGKIGKEKIVEKMCHNPAILFEIADRGFLDEGAYADLILVDPNTKYQLVQKDILYKCNWSPLVDKVLRGRVKMTFVNGAKVYQEGKILEASKGKRLMFDRNN